MKFILLLLCFLFSLNLFSQKVTSSYLIGGIWHPVKKDTATRFEFLNDRDIVLSEGERKGFSTKYYLDTLSATTLVSFDSIEVYWLVKIIDKNTIKVQKKFMSEKPVNWEWDLNEDGVNTKIAKREND
ncbi:MAG: hypothetical protein V4556_07440 [Bacteroidota bacterium]